MDHCIDEGFGNGHGREVDEDNGGDDDSPDDVSASLDERRKGPPLSSSSLVFPLDGRKFSPLVLGVHGLRRTRASSEIGSNPLQ